IMTPAARTVPIHTLSPIINTIQPRPQTNNTSRRLPQLPMRELPTITPTNPSATYFDLQNDDDEIEANKFARTNELFYYQTSSESSSNSNNSLTSDNSNHGTHEGHTHTDQHDDEYEYDDEQTSPFEYDA
ncbi:unnamed protein product, partial [Rotaria socialis]